MATSLQFPLILSQGVVQTPTSEQFIKGCDNFPKQITPGSFISQGRKKNILKRKGPVNFLEIDMLTLPVWFNFL